jgi:hypothetical protein
MMDSSRSLMISNAWASSSQATSEDELEVATGNKKATAQIGALSNGNLLFRDSQKGSDRSLLMTNSLFPRPSSCCQFSLEMTTTRMILDAKSPVSQ